MSDAIYNLQEIYLFYVAGLWLFLIILTKYYLMLYNLDYIGYRMLIYR
jgi:hypothetical protein